MVKNKQAALEDKELQAQVDAVAQELGDNGRILVRPSGTEPDVYKRQVIYDGDGNLLECMFMEYNHALDIISYIKTLDLSLIHIWGSSCQ